MYKCLSPSPSHSQVTVDVNHIEPDLTKLFPPQLVMDNTPNNAVGLRFLQGSEVTIVASRNTKRYRLQSDSLAAVGVALEWLLWRLEKYFSGGKSKFKGGFIPPLPLNEYFEIIERHYKVHVMYLCVCVCVCVCVCYSLWKFIEAGIVISTLRAFN